MRTVIRLGVLLGVFGLLMLMSSAAQAEEVSGVEDLHIDTPTLAKGYTVSAPDDRFFVGIRREVLAEETRVIIKQFRMFISLTFSTRWLFKIVNLYC